jgi:hypothetical protein
MKSRWVIMEKVSVTGNNGNEYRFLVGKPKGIKTPGRPRHGKKIK